MVHDNPNAANLPKGAQIKLDICPGKMLLEELHAPKNIKKPVVKKKKKTIKYITLHKHRLSIKHISKCFRITQMRLCDKEIHSKLLKDIISKI